MPLARRVGPALVSLGIAVLFWLLVRNLDRTPARFTVPVAYDFPEDALVLVERVAEVEISVRATKPKLRTLQAAEFVVKVRNREGRPGREFVVLDSNDVEAPFGVTVERVTPAQFVIQYEERSIRNATVRAVVEGKPAPGFAIDTEGIRVRPTEVRVAGPASQFDDPMIVSTERVDVSGRNQDLRSRGVTLIRPGPAFSFDGPATVEVEVPIRPITSRRTFEDVPVTVIEGDRNVSAPNPRRLRVTVEGPQLQVESLAARSLSVVVDASGLAPQAGDYQLEPRVEIEEGACDGCKVVGRSQARINLTVRPSRRGRS